MGPTLALAEQFLFKSVVLLYVKRCIERQYIYIYYWKKKHVHQHPANQKLPGLVVLVRILMLTLVSNSFLFLVVRPGAPSNSSVLAPSSDALCS